MNRRLVGLSSVLASVTIGLAVWVSVTRADDGPPSSHTAASTPGGSLTFTIPASWRTLPCPADEGDCIRVAAPGMDEGQAATVSFIPPNPVEGTPVDVLITPDVTVPGSTAVTVDGLPARRLDPDSAGQDAILVAGRARTEAGYAFMVLCPVAGDAGPSRAVCDEILRTLKVTR